MTAHERRLEHVSNKMDRIYKINKIQTGKKIM